MTRPPSEPRCVPAASGVASPGASLPVPAAPAAPRPARAALWLACVPAVAALTVAGAILVSQHLGGFVREEGHKRSLRIMTWNIGKLYLRWESRASDRDLDHVASVIHKSDAHVVALQELRGPAQMGRLVSALGPGWRASVPQDRYDRRAGLLVRLPARFVGLATSTGRIAQAAILTLPDGHRITVVSLHLDLFDAERRRRQAEEILAGAERLGIEDIFLAGDFNFDPAVAAHKTSDQGLYSFLCNELVDAAKYAGPTSVLSRRLDYVFYRSGRVRQVTSQVLQDQRINIMDHDPLLVELFM